MNDYKERRKRLNIKRDKLAVAAGISASTLWRIEEGKSNPSPLVAKAIERALSRREEARRG